MRLLPDVALQADGVRSTNDAFRDEIEAILDRIIPTYVPGERLLIINASDVTESFDWWAIAERLATLVGETLCAPARRSRSKAMDARERAMRRGERSGMYTPSRVRHEHSRPPANLPGPRRGELEGLGDERVLRPRVCRAVPAHAGYQLSFQSHVLGRPRRVGVKVVAEEEVCPLPCPSRLAHVDVHRPRLAGGRPKESMLRLPGAKLPAERLDLRAILVLRVQASNAHLDIDHRLGIEAGYGRRTDVVDSQRRRPKSVSELASDVIETSDPGWIGPDQLDWLPAFVSEPLSTVTLSVHRCSGAPLARRAVGEAHIWRHPGRPDC